MSNLENIQNIEAKISKLVIFKNKLNLTYKASSIDNEIFKKASSDYQALVYNSKNDVVEFLNYQEANEKFNNIIPPIYLYGGVNYCNVFLNNNINQLNHLLFNLKRNIK